MTAPNLNIFFANLLIEFLVRAGVKDFSISPGSRSTPLVVAATEHPETEVKVIIDERGSGYNATGFARASGKPVAVVCTSGTAAANFFPSVIEACNSRLPVIFITADRPEELQNRGANQTIDQIGLFGKYTRSISFEAPDDTFNPPEILSALNNAVKELNEPLHINCRFREPLAPVEAKYEAESLQEQVENWFRTNQINDMNISPENHSIDPKDLGDKINRSDRGIIIAGPENPQKLPSNLIRLSEKLDWPVIADILSQQRLCENENICSFYDLYLDWPDTRDRLCPEIVIHFGGVPVSKRLNQFLLGCSGIEYIKIQDHDRVIDPDRLETQKIIGDPDQFINALIPHIDRSKSRDYLKLWRSVEGKCSAYLEEYFAGQSLTEPGLAWQLARILGEGEALFLSNSMPVRDADNFMNFRNSDIMVGCNRGVNGVDGVIASACGFARGSRRRTTLVIGDLAFLHDLNSLEIASQSEIPINIVVTNNNGGAIFHFLPIAGYAKGFEKYFATPTNMNVQAAGQIFGIDYYHPSTTGHFRNDLEKSRKNVKPSIIEITIDRRQNLREHDIIRNNVHNILTL